MATAAHDFLARLAAHGVDYLFANAGTDFAPLIEAVAEQAVPSPVPVLVPHESAAIGMAHGYYLATGRPQAVMVHTNVGLANALMGIINAATDQAPMLIASGRTPMTEQGRIGSRSTPINWGQEMRDQNGMVREAVKWDADLRHPEQMTELVDRALSIAQSHPKGPVYLSLPRETLCEPLAAREGQPRPLPAPARIAPCPDAVAAAARLLERAEAPLIISHRDGGGDGVSPLQIFAEKHAIPVVEFWPSRNAIGSGSPMHQGYDPAALLAEADVVLVIDTLVPWLPDRHQLADRVKVIQTGPDPLHIRFPVRGFPSDVSLVGHCATILAALDAAVAPRPDRAQARRERFADANRGRREAAKARAVNGAVTPMRSDWVGHCLSEALGGDGLIVTELGVPIATLERPKAGTYFSNPVSGGLGWALPAALGMKLARPEEMVVACIGDGSYMFANPPVCHQLSEALDLPILIIVMNNAVWNAVRWATLEIYPDGAAARANVMPLTSLTPAPDYGKLAEASRGWSERVEDPQALSDALRRAMEVVRTERRQALLDIRVAI